MHTGLMLRRPGRVHSLGSDDSVERYYYVRYVPYAGADLQAPVVELYFRLESRHLKFRRNRSQWLKDAARRWRLFALSHLSLDETILLWRAVAGEGAGSSEVEIARYDACEEWEVGLSCGNPY